MRKVKYCAVVVCLMLSSGASGYAVSSNLGVAKDVVHAVHATDQFDMFLPQATAIVKRRILADHPKDEKIIGKTVDAEAMKLVKRRAELDDAAAKIYAKYFSLSELKAIAAFYNGPVGVKLLQNAPQLMGELVKSFNDWSASVGKALENNSRAALKGKLSSK